MLTDPDSDLRRESCRLRFDNPHQSLALGRTKRPLARSNSWYLWQSCDQESGEARIGFGQAPDADFQTSARNLTSLGGGCVQPPVIAGMVITHQLKPFAAATTHALLVRFFRALRGAAWSLLQSRERVPDHDTH